MYTPITTTLRKEIKELKYKLTTEVKCTNKYIRQFHKAQDKLIMVDNIIKTGIILRNTIWQMNNRYCDFPYTQTMFQDHNKMIKHFDKVVYDYRKEKK